MRRLDLDRERANFQHGRACRAGGSLREFAGPRRPQCRTRDLVPHLAIGGRTRLGIALERAAVFLGANDVLGPDARLLPGVHEDVVDVGLAIGEAHDLRLGTGRRQLTGQSIPFQPTKALLLFDGQDAALQGFAERFRRAIEGLHAHHAQRQFVRRDRQLHVLKQTAALFRIETPRIPRRVRSVIELGRVLREQHDRMRPHPPQRGLPMRLENRLGGHGVVVEKLIRGQRVAPAVTGPVDARLRIRRQRLDHPHAPLVQSLAPQTNAVQFLRDSLAHRRASWQNWQIETAETAGANLVPKSGEIVADCV